MLTYEDYLASAACSEYREYRRHYPDDSKLTARLTMQNSVAVALNVYLPDGLAFNFVRWEDKELGLK